MDKIKKDKVCIVVPVYNEAPVIRDTIHEIQQAGYKNIIVVDDGSSDKSYEELLKERIVLLRLLINRGKGAAIRTGIEAAKILKAGVIVTIDGDGQHNPKEIEKFVKLIKESKYDVVLGTRLRNVKGMPKYKIWANYIGNFFTWLFYGLWVTDSQSGFRAYSKNAISLINTKTDRYEYDSEVIKEIKRHNLKYTEIPIDVRYTKYSMSKVNRQGFKNGIKTLIKMLISI